MGYGNIMNVETTGASMQTARWDQLNYSGVRASETMAQMDSGRMQKYKSMIISVGRRYDIEPALIAAIISRESRAGNMLKGGWGDNQKAWGLMQVDCTATGGRHKPEGNWDSEEHLCHGTRELVKKINLICDKFPSWSSEQQLKGGLAAYNMGERNVHSYENVDENTTGRDYSNDVIARAQWYKRNGNLEDGGWECQLQ